MKFEGLIQETVKVERTGEIRLTMSLDEAEKLAKLVNTIIALDLENSKADAFHSISLLPKMSEPKQLSISDFHALSRFRNALEACFE